MCTADESLMPRHMETNGEVWRQEDGAGDRSRTYDLRITNALLYQLSYTGAEAVHYTHLTEKQNTVYP
jgi:hypothetical protein